MVITIIVMMINSNDDNKLARSSVPGTSSEPPQKSSPLRTQPASRPATNEAVSGK